MVLTKPKSMRLRSWFLMAADGTCLARTPEFSSGKRVSSIGKKFALRDYFPGLGQDLPPTTRSVRVLDAPHNSAAIFSSVDGKMTATFTVPILDSGKTMLDSEKNGIGTLAVCVECSEFSDLKLEESSDQQLLLVDARGYPIIEMEWSDEKEQVLILGPPQWSAGVLLHHENNLYHPTFNGLKRIDAEIGSRSGDATGTPVARAACELAGKRRSRRTSYHQTGPDAPPLRKPDAR